MTSKVFFNYKYKGAPFGVVAQPIIENSTKKMIAFKLLSYNIDVNGVEVAWDKLSPADATSICCIHMEKLAELLSNGERCQYFKFHINIHYKTLFNVKFIRMAKKTRFTRFAFEINGLECSAEQMNRLKNMFAIIKSYGHEIWLSEYGINKSTVALLIALPWSGVKVDKEIVLRSSIRQLDSLVNVCKHYVEKVMLDGVDDEYLYNLSLYSNSTFSQGFYWNLLDREYFIHQTP